MDSGFLAPGESLDDDYDVLRKLVPEQVIGIIDQLICFEVGIRRAFNIPMWTKSDADARGLIGGVAYGSSTIAVAVHFQLH